jgi:hypothetical protein
MRDLGYTCARHQQMFVEIVRRGGCFGRTRTHDLRRKTLAWLAVRFPRMVLDHFNEGSCLGCKLESNGLDVAEIERVITGLAQGLSLDEAPPRPTR